MNDSVCPTGTETLPESPLFWCGSIRAGAQLHVVSPGAPLGVRALPDHLRRIAGFTEPLEGRSPARFPERWPERHQRPARVRRALICQADGRQSPHVPAFRRWTLGGGKDPGPEGLESKGRPRPRPSAGRGEGSREHRGARPRKVRDPGSVRERVSTDTAAEEGQLCTVCTLRSKSE